MRRAELQLETLRCPSCVKKIEGTLKNTKGVVEGKVLFNSSKIKLDFDETVVTFEDIHKFMEKLGYEIVSKKIA